MKLRVCVAFSDKVTGADYNVGDVIDVTEARGAEIMSHPGKLVEVVESESPKPQKSASPATRPKSKRGVKKNDA